MSTALTIAALLQIGHQCSPAIAPATLLGHMQVESGRNPYAINVNHVFEFRVTGYRVRRQPQTYDAAVRAAEWLEARHIDFQAGGLRLSPSTVHAQGLRWEQVFNPCSVETRHPKDSESAIAAAKCLQSQGYTFAGGLGQLMNYTAARFGMGWADVFDPCSNLAATQRHLLASYRREIDKGADHHSAVLAAYSEFESGDPRRGLRDGYVARVASATATATRQLSNGFETVSTLPIGGRSQTRQRHRSPHIVHGD